MLRYHRVRGIASPQDPPFLEPSLSIRSPNPAGSPAALRLPSRSLAAVRTGRGVGQRPRMKSFRSRWLAGQCRHVCQRCGWRWQIEPPPSPSSVAMPLVRRSRELSRNPTNTRRTPRRPHLSGAPRPAIRTPEGIQLQPATGRATGNGQDSIPQAAATNAPSDRATTKLVSYSRSTADSKPHQAKIRLFGRTKDGSCESWRAGNPRRMALTEPDLRPK